MLDPINLEKWCTDNGENLRYAYDLTPESIVVDVGAFKGGFAERMFDTYGCRLYCCEPVPEFYKLLETKFEGNNAITILKYGLGPKTKETTFRISDDASKEETGDDAVSVKIVDYKTFLSDNQLNHVDLLKLNIEGAEYDLLDFILDNNLHHMIENIQIQFHLVGENPEERRRRIVRRLTKTHKVTYNYPFVWENYRLKH